MTDPVWVPRAAIDIIHQERLAEHGGAQGVRDAGLLESALARPVNAWHCGETDLCELAAFYAEGIARNHPFVDPDGIHGRLHLSRPERSRPRRPEPEAVQNMLGLAAGEITRDAFAVWLRERSIHG